MLAGSIAYFFLMSFVPFCLLLITIFGYFLGESRAFHDFFAIRLISLFPAATNHIISEMTALVTYRRIGILTFVIYAYFSAQLYLALENAVHKIFYEKTRTTLLLSLFKSLLIVSLIVVFVIFSFAATSVVQMLDPMITTYMGLKMGFGVGILIRFVIPVCLVFLITTTFYIMVPLKKVTLRDAATGGLFTVFFLDLARHLFTIYVLNTAGQFGAIYASLSTIVVFLLWIYYAACIFLVGAELVRSLEVEHGKNHGLCQR